MKTATPQDTYDAIIGSGALESYYWWHAIGIKGMLDDGATDEWSASITADDGDGGETTTVVDHRQILKLARYVLANKGKTLTTRGGTVYPAWSRELERECSHLIFNADDMDFDANSADELLQLICLGEVVFS